MRVFQTQGTQNPGALTSSEPLSVPPFDDRMASADGWPKDRGRIPFTTLTDSHQRRQRGSDEVVGGRARRHRDDLACAAMTVVRHWTATMLAVGRSEVMLVCGRVGQVPGAHVMAHELDGFTEPRDESAHESDDEQHLHAVSL